jgi:hypothetical protein
MIHEVKIFTEYTSEMDESEVNAFLCIDVTSMTLIQLIMCS